MLQETPSAVDPARCPVCGLANSCAAKRRHANGELQPPCWCLQATFGPEILARVPTAALGLACICSACAGQPAAPGN